MTTNILKEMRKRHNDLLKNGWDGPPFMLAAYCNILGCRHWDGTDTAVFSNEHYRLSGAMK